MWKLPKIKPLKGKFLDRQALIFGHKRKIYKFWMFKFKESDKKFRKRIIEDLNYKVKKPYQYWHYDAAEKFINYLEEIYGCAYELLMSIRESENSNLIFHFTVGMEVRNKLRDLGYTDNKYGNLDDHYKNILKIAYEKVGIY